MIVERIFRVDRLEFKPYPARLVDLTKMAESRSEKSAGQIGLGYEQDTLLEDYRSGFIFAGSNARSESGETVGCRPDPDAYPAR
jgi:hypothetical protein